MQVFGKYTLIRMLGRGGMAEVWLARDASLGRQVALKLLPPGAEISGPTRDRFVREARAMAQLNSSRIVTVFEMGVIDSRVFIAMGYVDGKSLAQEVEDGPKDWRSATRDVRDAALALHDAHEAGVIHRDVKPSNIMRGKNGELVVVDLGLARIGSETSQLSQAGSVLGTPQFMSPEQCRGEAVDARSDLYSLICTYYALLVGRAPFAPSRPETALYHHVHTPFPDPRILVPDLPPAVCEVIAKGTRKHPRARFETARELVDVLNVLLGETGVRDPFRMPPARHADDSSEGVYLADSGGWSWTDLTITIQEQTVDGYPILIVAPQTYGCPAGFMTLDLDSEMVRGWQQKVDADACSRRDLEDFGAFLFERLFPGDLATTYELNVNSHLCVQERRGLRIRVHVLAQRLQQVPWEIAFQRIRGVVLGTDTGIALSRFVAAPAPKPVGAKGALRVLLCSAAPRALPATDATVELTTIEHALSEEARVSIRMLRNCTRGELIRSLDDFRPHVFHFVGHGQARGRVPGILLESEADDEFLSADLVLEILARPGSVRLAVLSACQSGTLAHALAGGGIPALGMLTDLANRAAMIFSRTLYRTIAHGHAIDQAVNAARRTLRIEVSPDRRDWFAPVLVLPQGIAHLFDLRPLPAQATVDSVPRGARIYLDGEPTEQVTPATIELAQPGRHVVQVVLPGQGMSAGKVISPASGSTVRVLFELPVAAKIEAPVRRWYIVFGAGIVVVALLIGWAMQQGGPATDGRSVPIGDAERRAQLMQPHDMIEVPAGIVHLGFRDRSVTVELLRAIKKRLSKPSENNKKTLDGVFKVLAAAPRPVRLPAFAIDRYEVTNKDYRAFLEAMGDKHVHCHPDEPAGHRHEPQEWGADDRPVTTVDWFDAYAYARWKGRRLPTEDEWELAARGDRVLPYPWGDKFDAAWLGQRGTEVPAVEDWRPPREGAVCGMAGGVREWTATPTTGVEMTIKGGSWIDGSDAAIYALGFARAPSMQRDSIAANVGFRCARDAVDDTPADMVLIPAATVTLGGENTPGLDFLRKWEPHRFVWDMLGDDPDTPMPVPAFRLDKYEVTNSQYRSFLAYIAATSDHSRCAPDEPKDKDHTPKFWSDPSFTADGQPVVGVDWYDAYAYASWAGRRLPRRVEWVRAARGDTFQLYPWGDAFDRGRCSCAENKMAAPALVTAFADGASPFGFVQMAGNATEWTVDEIRDYQTPLSYLLGGGWNEPGESMTVLFYYPFANSKMFRDASSGIRCAQDR